MTVERLATLLFCAPLSVQISASGCVDEGPADAAVYVGAPLPLSADRAWAWVPFEDTVCRDGSATGIGVRAGSTDRLVINLRGGAACFNAVTCTANPDAFDALDFDSWARSPYALGILDADDPDNPVAAWHHVMVPYCSGDLHAGDARDVRVDGVAEPQQFQGFRNVDAFLQRIVPTFRDVGEVLLVGTSAGGIGALFNADRVAAAFPDATFTLIDDSGLLLPDRFVPPCFQRRLRDLWGLDRTLPAGCAECFAADGGGLAALVPYLARRHAAHALGFVMADGDLILRVFYSFGRGAPDAAVCPDEALPPPMTEAFFSDGIYALRDTVLRPLDNVASFVVASQDHTFLPWERFRTVEARGESLRTWVGDVLRRDLRHVAP